MEYIENKKERANIQGFRKKLEETYGIKMDEQDAQESFTNFSGFIHTLIDIDKATVVLVLNESQFHISEHEKFDPSTLGLFQHPYYKLGKRANFRCVQNPTKKELAAGIYKPRLTVTKRYVNTGFAIALKIEFSAPKMIYGNNFDELNDTDFDAIITKLIALLAEMGVHTNYNFLAEASIAAIHYSKNIALTDYSKCSMLINELWKLDLNKSMDLSGTDFRNEGQAIRYHTNGFEIVFYDKIKDLEQAKKSDKRAMENDNKIQLGLFDKKEFSKKFEVLRMEIRFGNRKKLEKVLTDLKINANLNFAMLFDREIAQKILLHYWQIITQNLHISLVSCSDYQANLERVLSSAKNISPTKQLALAGLMLITDSLGLRAARQMIETKKNSKTIARLKADIRGLGLKQHPKFQAIANIESQLKAFNNLKLKEYVNVA